LKKQIKYQDLKISIDNVKILDLNPEKKENILIMFKHINDLMVYIIN